jgi:hypothetical protein
MVDLFWDHVMANSLRPLERIDCWLPLPQPYPHFETQLARALSYIAVKVINESALQQQSECRDFEIQFQLVQRSLWALDLQLKFCLLGKMPTNCTEHYPVQDLTPPRYLLLGVEVGRRALANESLALHQYLHQCVVQIIASSLR